jgi:hypothetical protein
VKVVPVLTPILAVNDGGTMTLRDPGLKIHPRTNDHGLSGSNSVHR